MARNDSFGFGAATAGAFATGAAAFAGGLSCFLGAEYPNPKKVNFLSYSSIIKTQKVQGYYSATKVCQEQLSK